MTKVLKPILQDAYDPVTPGQIDALESRIGSRFPREYRDFMLQQNGGSYRQDVIYTPRHDKCCSYIAGVQKLDPILGEDDGIIWHYDVMKAYIPTGFLPFGTDGMGNSFCFKLDGGDKQGSLWFWDHELSWDNGMEWVAPDFLTFIDGITYDPEADWEQTEPAFVACERGDVAELKDLIRQGRDKDSRNDKRNTLLMVAAGSPQPEIVAYLLSLEPDLELCDDRGRTSLHYASGSLDCTRLLTSAGANVNVSDREGETPLMCAIRRHADRVALLLIRYGADVNADAGDGFTPMWLCMQRHEYDRKQLKEALLNAGATD